MSLISSNNFDAETELKYPAVFYRFFKSNTHIKNKEGYDLLLPATKLTHGCYTALFSGCKKLSKAPALPATVLAEHCYDSMFAHCEDIQTAPALPPTTLAAYCYTAMFSGCTGLTTSPSLPAATLTEGCYSYMFENCSRLNSVTCLATNISANRCTENWLKGVAASGTFTKAAGMTSWPTNSASGIPSGWTVENSPYTIPFTLEACDAGAVVTFDNQATGPVNYKVNGGAEQTIACSTTGTITLSAIGDKVEFFADNKTYTPDGSSGSRITISKDCYIYGNVMSLVKSINFESARTLEEPRTFAGLFLSNTHIKNKNGIDLLLPATTLTDDCYLYMFSHCSELTRAPALPATTLTADCYACMFEDCTSLTSAPSLPATTMKPACYSCMFSHCQSLTKAPDLPATVLAKYCYEEMFAACTSLTSAPSLPATTLEKECYYKMFFSCTNLTTAPELPATTLADQCYGGMFENCRKLSSVTCLATDISADKCTKDWLNGVAATGTFTKAKDVDWSGKTGTSGIPSGWQVVEK